MELTVRLARPTDYEEIDKLTYKGYITAMKECDEGRFDSGNLTSADTSNSMISAFTRTGSYLCTVKGSANMRASDALTFVCVEHTQKKSFLKSIFSRVRRGSEENVFASANPNVQAGIKEISPKGERRQSVRFQGMRRKQSDSSSTATGSSERVGRKIRKNNVPDSTTLGIMKDKSVCMLAAEALPADMENYRSCGTLTGHEEEFGIGQGIRTRVKRQEGPELSLNKRNSVGSFDLSQYDPSRGVSAYKKPQNIELEASITPEGFVISRPSPALDATEIFTESRDHHRNSVDVPPPSRSFFHPRRNQQEEFNLFPCEIENCASEKIVGCVTYAPYESGWGIVSEPNDVEIRLLSVAPVRGVAGSLIDHCIRIGHEERRTDIHVLVNAANKPAHLLYIRHGFKRNPEKDRYDAKSGTELKCFTIGLGHERPPTAPGPMAVDMTMKGVSPTDSESTTASVPEKIKPGVMYNLRESRDCKEAAMYQRLLSEVAPDAPF